MTGPLISELRPLFAVVLSGPAVQRAAEELIRMADADGCLRFGRLDRKVMEQAGVSESTLKRARRELRAHGLLAYLSGIGHRCTQYAWNLQRARELLTKIVTPRRGHGRGQHVSDQKEIGPWRGRAPHGPAGGWDATAMDVLVTDVRAIRPAWNVRGIRAAAARSLRNGATMQTLRPALLSVARAGDSRTPMRVSANGWWWDAADARHQTPPPYQRAATPATIGRDVVERVRDLAAHHGGRPGTAPGRGRVDAVRHQVTDGDGSAELTTKPRGWLAEMARQAQLDLSLERFLASGGRG